MVVLRAISGLPIPVVLLLLAACGGGSTPAGSTTGEPAGTTAQEALVRIDKGAFHPREVTVGAGATVIFANEDIGAHTATAAEGESFRYDSGILPSGSTFTQTYRDPGAYDFVCTLHPTMVGTITVEQA